MPSNTTGEHGSLTRSRNGRKKLPAEVLGTVRALCFRERYLNPNSCRNAIASMVFRSRFSSNIMIVMFFPANVKFLEMFVESCKSTLKQC